MWQRHLPQRLDQDRQAHRVVRDIEQPLPATVDSTRESHSCKPLVPLGCRRPEGLRQGTQHDCRHRRIPPLECATESEVAVVGRVRVDSNRSSTRTECGLLQYGCEGTVCLTDHERASGLRNPSLLPSDAFEGGSEIVYVLEPDRRHDTDQRIDDVGAVQATAKPDLDHRDVGPTCREVRKCDRRCSFEKAGLDRLDRLSEFLRPRREGAARDGPAIDHHALTNIDEVRRGIGRYAPTGTAERCGNQGRDRPLAVGPTHVNRRILAFGMTKSLEEGPRRFERPLPAPVGTREQVCLRVGKAECQSLTSASGAPVIIRRSRAIVERNCARGTTMSTIPCSSRNSAV